MYITSLDQMGRPRAAARSAGRILTRPDPYRKAMMDATMPMVNSTALITVAMTVSLFIKYSLPVILSKSENNGGYGAHDLNEIDEHGQGGAFFLFVAVIIHG
jgi:hypothetical protein